jgi:phage terminase large subunit GpA-like protein
MRDDLGGASEYQALRAAARAVRIPKRLGVAEWADEFRRLSPKASAIPGPWRTARVPYLRGVMDALDLRHPAEMVTFMKSAQTAGSEAALNWLGWLIHQTPAPILVTFPTEKLGLRWMRGRLRPMIQDSDALRGLLPLGRSSTSSNTLQELHFPGGVLYLGSANVPSDLSSVPVAIVLMDEVDRMPRAIEGEGDPAGLAWARTNTFQGRRKMARISTPTDEGSAIDAAYHESSQGQYHVPCPHCQAMQPLEWERLKWPDGKPDEAKYQCASCGELIDEAAKPAMLAAGEWIHRYPERVGQHIGFHINCLYAPPALGDSWAANARAWIEAQEKPEKLQVFFNTRLGKVHREHRVRVEWEDVRDRKDPALTLGEPPNDVCLLTCGVDIQGDRIETEVGGWSRGERFTVIDHTILPGDPATPGAEVWMDLDRALQRKYTRPDGLALPLACTIIDAGFAQTEVLKFARDRRARNVYAGRGHVRADKPVIGVPTKMDVKFRGLADRRGTKLYWLGVSEIKRVIYRRLAADAALDLAVEEGRRGEVLPTERWFRFPAELSEAWFRQFVAEEFDETKQKWVKRQERNEALDMIVYAFAAAYHHSIRVDRFKAEDWDRIEQSMRKPNEATEQPGAFKLTGPIMK